MNTTTHGTLDMSEALTLKELRQKIAGLGNYIKNFYDLSNDKNHDGDILTSIGFKTAIGMINEQFKNAGFYTIMEQENQESEHSNHD